MHDFLAARAPATLMPARIGVVGPTYLPIGVSAIVVPRNPGDAGLVERIQHGDDRRRQTLKLTKRGERTLDSARNALQVGLLDLIAEADLPPPEAHAE